VSREQAQGFANNKGLRTNDSGLILEGFKIVISFFMPVILLVTVIASVGFGVLAAYAMVFGILATFGRSSQAQPRPEPSRPRLVLVPTQEHASGD